MRTVVRREKGSFPLPQRFEGTKAILVKQWLTTSLTADNTVWIGGMSAGGVKAITHRIEDSSLESPHPGDQGMQRS
jgi:hypothetical protein